MDALRVLDASRDALVLFALIIMDALTLFALLRQDVMSIREKNRHLWVPGGVARATRRPAKHCKVPRIMRVQPPTRACQAWYVDTCS